MRVVVLVPWRPSSEERMAAWSFIRPHLESYGWPVVTGNVDGRWNRAAAINAAAAEAEPWDVAVIADADTYHDASVDMPGAVGYAGRCGGAVVPWSKRRKLSKLGTARLIVGDGVASAECWDHADPTPDKSPLSLSGATIVVSRDAWDMAGGFDARFVGWGHEDVAFRIALQAFAPGGLRGRRGLIWHLWHERKGPASRNMLLKRRYVDAAGDPDRLRMVMGR